MAMLCRNNFRLRSVDAGVNTNTCTARASEFAYQAGHALAGGGVRQSAETGLHVVQQVFGFAGGGNCAGNGRVAEYEFEKELGPRCAIDILGPYW